MAIRYITREELDPLARSIWYAPRTKVTKTATSEKIATFPTYGYENRSTEFPMRSGEWIQTGNIEIMVEYPMWDIPGKIHVRRYQERED